MRSFWLSLLAFVLLMCGCKSEAFVHEMDFGSREKTVINQTKYQALIDTSTVLGIEIDKSKLRIVETFKITEYDKESGKPIKETKATRETIQDSDKVVTTEEERGQSKVKNDSLNHIADVSKKVESETKEESKGGQEAFGKWIGIVIGCVIGFLIIYLLKKFRVN